MAGSAINVQPDFKAPCEAKQQAGIQFSGGIQTDYYVSFGF